GSAPASASARVVQAGWLSGRATAPPSRRSWMPADCLMIWMLMVNSLEAVGNANLPGTECRFLARSCRSARHAAVGLTTRFYVGGYRARIGLEKLGDTLTVFTKVTLCDRRREDLVRFETSIRSVDEIVECHLINGGHDYLLKFITRGVHHYQELVERLLERNI